MARTRTPTARTRLARRLVPAVLIAAALLLVTFSIRAQADVVSAQGTASDTTSTIQEVATRATQPVRDLIGWFGDIRSARTERDTLAAENATLRAELSKAEVNQQDAEELRGLLNYVKSPAFPETKAYTPRAARVVARSPSLTSSTVIVDAGENAGVQVGDPVLAGVAAGRCARAQGGNPLRSGGFGRWPAALRLREPLESPARARRRRRPFAAVMGCGRCSIRRGVGWGESLRQQLGRPTA